MPQMGAGVASDATVFSRKRKAAQTGAPQRNPGGQKCPKMDFRARQREARTLSTQMSSKAFKNGELDVDRFVKSREYEIRALEDGMARSKEASTKRAFQQVPKELRRRTASHNVKKIPKRLRKRGAREMLEDNTPTVTARKRKPSRHQRLRLETAKRLRALSAKKKHDMASIDSSKVSDEQTWSTSGANEKGIRTRHSKIKSSTLVTPPAPRGKFAKRQKHKTWLPTHLFHAKRATMTPPSQPLWRFAIPLRPTAKSYRPTHRAANQRGAIAWDTSYFSTIGLEGRQRSIDTVLRSLGVDQYTSNGSLKTGKAERWRRGTRTWTGLLHEREHPTEVIGPATVIWCVSAPQPDPANQEQGNSLSRNVLIRIHPSAFHQLWEEVIRMAKTAKPAVRVEDLRFELGSIEITGPGATEALSAAIQPTKLVDCGDTVDERSVEYCWSSLGSLNSIGLLPADVLLAFDAQDPRLRITRSPAQNHQTSQAGHETFLRLLADWPVDLTQQPAALFTGPSRRAAAAALPSQRAINRRKAAAAPGQCPKLLPSDPKIPVLLYTVQDGMKGPAKWVALMPWKCVQPIWYGLVYHPLSTGSQPRFAGVDQIRQLDFEAGRPWFPGDFPGTQAGFKWELSERKRRLDEWKRKPKSKRICWDSLQLGTDAKGELGRGWTCDWERLLQSPKQTGSNGVDPNTIPASIAGAEASNAPQKGDLHHLTSAMHKNTAQQGALVVVRLQILTRGIPQACARIYRIPATGLARKRWLDQFALQRSSQQRCANIRKLPVLSSDAPPHIVQRRLAQSLLTTPKAGQPDHPTCPSEEDLIGFVTSGNFNLSEGCGTGIGSILWTKVGRQAQEDDEIGKLCIVRNAGETVGRLARWEKISM